MAIVNEGEGRGGSETGSVEALLMQPGVDRVDVATVAVAVQPAVRASLNLAQGTSEKTGLVFESGLKNYRLLVDQASRKVLSCYEWIGWELAEVLSEVQVKQAEPLVEEIRELFRWQGSEFVEIALPDGSATDKDKPKRGEKVPGWVERYRRGMESQVVDPLPADYDELRRRLGNIQNFNRRMIAEAVEPALNARAASMPHGILEEKKILAKWVNEELRHFDLAIECPSTRRPATLIATTGKRPGIGQFRFETMKENGQPTYSASSVALPTLKLMPVPFGQSRVFHQHTARGR
ncbi:MAG: hypothetical protein AB7N24_22430 [Dehalococcoidia bacterium]